MRLHEERERYIIREFFQAFKSNFKQSTGAFLIQFFVGAVLAIDLYFWWVMKELSIRGIMLAATLVMLLFYLISSLYLYPLISKFKNPLAAQIKNSLLFPVLYLPYTVIMVGFTGLLLYMYASGSFNTTFLLFLGIPLLLFLYTKVFSMVFTKHIADHMSEYASSLSEAEQKRYMEDALLLNDDGRTEKKKKKKAPKQKQEKE